MTRSTPRISSLGLRIAHRVYVGESRNAKCELHFARLTPVPAVPDIEYVQSNSMCLVGPCKRVLTSSETKDWSATHLTFADERPSPSNL